MPAQLLMGVETEYAIKPLGNINAEQAGMLLMTYCKQTFPYLMDFDSKGIFLANGGRFYIDRYHPEFCTPECTSPHEVVKYLLANDYLIMSLTSLYPGYWEVSKNNVCYLNRQAWGCHESYLSRLSPLMLSRILIPHLVSRVIYTGAGGFDPFYPGIRFLLSPRTAFLKTVIGSDSMEERPIFHTRDESLSNGNEYHRCHIIYGESLFSHQAVFLKCGTTALLIAMAEAGVLLESSIELKNPLLAAMLISQDPTGEQVIKLKNGYMTSALEIQHYYLNLAKLHINDSFMPAWTGEVCEIWENVLKSFKEDPSYLQRSLDAHIKWALFSRFLENNGLSMDDLQEYNRYMEHINQRFNILSAFEATINKCPTDLKMLQKDVIKKLIVGRGTYLPESILYTSKKIIDFLKIRYHLLTLDLQFSKLGPDGIFNLMDQDGVLDHRHPEIDSIPQAINIPPQNGRAAIRGHSIARLSNSDTKYMADWTAIYDSGKTVKLNLSNPFEDIEVWEVIPHT